MKYNYTIIIFCNTQNWWKEWHHFTCVRISLVSDLMEDSCTHLVWNAVLTEVYLENTLSHRHVVGKVRSILTAFSDNCGYFSLMLR